MISYKTWKLLQENMGQTNLGVKSPNVLGITESPLFGMMKKKKGFPGAEEGPPAPDMGGADATDGEDLDAHPDDDDEMGDEEGLGDEEMGDDEMGDEEGLGDDEMGDEEGLGDDEMGDEEGGGDMGGDMGGPPMKKKKPPMDIGAKSPMMMRSYMKKESKDVVDEKSKKQNSANGADMLKMKEKGGKKCCSACSKMQKEENEFLSKLRNMTGGTKFAVDDEGYWNPIDEDALIAPDNTHITNNEPGPGEVGYAPTQKIGSNFQEWANKHVAKTRK